MFTQRCFIRKNTKELVEKLKELGYNQSFSARGNYVDSLQTTWNNMEEMYMVFCQFHQTR